MKTNRMNLLFASALAGGALLCFPTIRHAHGGQYRGPGDVVPGGGSGSGGGGGAGPAGGPSGPTAQGPAGPSRPGAGGPGRSVGLSPSTGSGSGGSPDLTDWPYWWEFNKEPYLNLKSKIHGEESVTGSDGFNIGHGEKRFTKHTYKPSDEQIRGLVVPALLAALETESDNDIVTGCLIALAKIGDAPSESGESPFEAVIARFLADKNQEISETAAVALGILANPRSIDTLKDLLEDNPRGRALVRQSEVDNRRRAFAAYGLGLIGKRAAREADRIRIVSILRRAFETDTTRTRDLRVGCVIAMGLVALETLDTLDSPALEKKGALVPPESSRSAQLEYLLAFLADDRQEHLVRAHCPTALARLLVGLPPGSHEAYRAKIAGDLLGRLEPRAKERNEVVQSSVQALGLIGTNDDANPLDRKIREALAGVSQDVAARNFAMISLAKIGARTAIGAGNAEGGLEEITKVLLARLAGGRGNVKAWAAISCGVLANELARTNEGTTRIATLQSAVRIALDEEGKDPSKLGALAIAAGLMGHIEVKERLVLRLDSTKDENARGYVAIGLGLMNAHDTTDKINRLVDASKYLPELLKQAAIALGLLGDKDVVPKLIALLQESRGQATQASLAKALGFIGDRRSIEPLIRMLQNQDLTTGARSFAAVALGIVSDKEDLPWNSKIALDLNYLAATQTLTEVGTGTGILDIL